MKIDLHTPQRVTLVIEKNKCETWSIGAYLITADGQRERRSLGVFDSYSDATESLKSAWQQAAI